MSTPASSSFPKTAFVVGGARGIGAAIVRRFANDGAKVAFTYTNAEDKALALVAEVEAGGGTALSIRADSADAEALAAAIAGSVRAHGGLDVLVNNAGLLVRHTIDDYSLADFDRMLAVNVRGVFVAAKAAASHMKAGGRIVTIGSIVADRAGFPGTSVYGMTKAAVAGLVRGLARDLGPRGITVNNVQPGPIETDMTPGDGATGEMLRAMSPLGRMGRPEEVADFVAYLVGPQAAYFNGASLTIDGGFMA
jgi:3-oxoacyl-[acyl-carrier protein] reductase